MGFRFGDSMFGLAVGLVCHHWLGLVFGFGASD